MKPVLAVLSVILVLLTACATGNTVTQVPCSSNSPLSPQTTPDENITLHLRFKYGDTIKVSGWSSINPIKLAKDQAKSQAFLNLYKILRAIVQENAKSIIDEYTKEAMQLFERMVINMSSIAPDYVTSVSYYDEQDDLYICMLEFDTRFVPTIYYLALETLKKEIDNEKMRLTEVTNQAIKTLEESEQLTEELRKYAYSKLNSEIQLQETAFTELKTENVLKMLETFNKWIEI